MSDDPRNVRIMLEKAEYDLSQAIFVLGEIQAQLETIATAVGANQRYTHLNRVTSLPAGSSSLSQIETAQAIPTAVSVQTPAQTALAPQTPQTKPSL
jgi:hypothetical protein